MQIRPALPVEIITKIMEYAYSDNEQIRSSRLLLSLLRTGRKVYNTLYNKMPQLNAIDSATSEQYYERKVYKEFLASFRSILCIRQYRDRIIEGRPEQILAEIVTLCFSRIKIARELMIHGLPFIELSEIMKISRDTVAKLHLNDLAYWMSDAMQSERFEKIMHRYLLAQFKHYDGHPLFYEEDEIVEEDEIMEEIEENEESIARKMRREARQQGMTRESFAEIHSTELRVQMSMLNFRLRDKFDISLFPQGLGILKNRGLIENNTHGLPSFLPVPKVRPPITFAVLYITLDSGFPWLSRIYIDYNKCELSIIRILPNSELTKISIEKIETTPTALLSEQNVPLRLEGSERKILSEVCKLFRDL